MKKKAFTLVELLVVIAIIALLMGILLPSLSMAKSQSRAIICRSNIRQILLANIGYSIENDDCMVLAARDIGGANLHRWHGLRETIDDPFDPLRGDLADYLADGQVKECPVPIRFRQGAPSNWDFEDGCGGYGYNDVYIGSRVWDSGLTDKATKVSEIRNPARTVMLADTAMSKLDGGVPYYLEYSFVVPRYWFFSGEFHPEWGNPSPSIHFRHRGKANVAWVDGHVDDRTMAVFDELNAYQVRSADMMLGWFEPLGNSQFDLK